MSPFADFLLFFQLRARLLTDDTPLTLAEAVFLDSLHHHQGETLKKLVSVTGLEKSTLSRTADRMINKGFISKTASKDDSRCIQLKLTKAGAEILSADDAARGRSTHMLVSALDNRQQQLLCEFLRQLADSMSIAAFPRRAEEHPIRVEQRRLTRGFRLLAGQILFSKLDITSLQILEAVQHGDFQRTCRELPFDQSTVSRAIQKLQKRGFVLSRISPDDKRARIIAATPHGLAALNNFKDSLSMYILRVCPRPMIDQMISIVDLFMSKRNQDYGQKESDRIAFHLVDNMEELKDVRSFYLEALVRKRKAREVGCELYLPSSKVLVGRKENDIVFACELRGGYGEITVHNFYLSERKLNQDQALIYLRSVLEKLPEFSDHTVAKIDLSDNALLVSSLPARASRTSR